MKDTDHQQLHDDFTTAVNMTPLELEKWLKTEDSKSVGWAHDDKGGANKTSSSGPEAVGHAMGRHIVSIKAKKQADLTEQDYAHMRKVVGYVHRHLAQHPKGDDDKIAHSRWRHSLMNWGHDPLKGH